jgi:predicted metal-binding membrane protein
MAGRLSTNRAAKKMTVPVDAAFEAIVRRDRLIVVAALISVVALSWVYLLTGAGMNMSTSGTGNMAMMTPAVWTPGYAVLMFFMWWVMMVAMMLPSAAPMILLFATINRKQHETSRPYAATSTFAVGYFAVWSGFSLVAVILQWGFEQTGLLSSMLVGTSAIFGGVVVLSAGIYQLTPIKHACLRHCRSPLAFLSAHWRPGSGGAFRMGLVHGAFCVGCCWFLMGLLFFGGVMNLYWIAGLALYVLFEKTVPAGHWLGYATGVALLAWGARTLAYEF